MLLKKTSILILSSLMASLPAFSIQQDKQKHIIASAAISSVSTALCSDVFDGYDGYAIQCGILSSLSFGVSKEVYDSRQPGNKFSSGDFIADIAGAFIGSALYYSTEKFIITPLLDFKSGSYGINLNINI